MVAVGGRRRRSSSQPVATRSAPAAAGEDTRRPAFWSHTEVSQSAARAAGSTPPITQPKNRPDGMATTPGSAPAMSASTTSSGSLPTSGSGPPIAAYERGTRNPSAEMTARLIQAARPRPSVLVDQYREEIRAVAHSHRAGHVEVFGSVARGTDEPGSDLDLLVTFDADASLLDQAALQADLE